MQQFVEEGAQDQRRHHATAGDGLEGREQLQAAGFQVLQVARLHPLPRIVLGQEAGIGPGEDQHGLGLDVVDGGGRLLDAQGLQVALLQVAARHHAAGGDALQQVRPGRLDTEQRVVAAAVETVALLVQRRIGQPRHAEGEMPYRQVQPAVQHPLLQLRRGTDVDMQVDLVAALDETLGGLFQRAGRVGDGGVDHPQVEGAADLALEHIGIHAEILHRAQQPLGGFVDRLPLLGQAEAAAAALAELDAEARLQVAHLLADGGLGDVEGCLGGREATAFDDGVEDPQQLQVHVVQLDHPAPRGWRLHRFLRFAHRIIVIFQGAGKAQDRAMVEVRAPCRSPYKNKVETPENVQQQL
ncbi:hypothetical protein D3C72_1302740 [compost metagenome]